MQSDPRVTKPSIARAIKFTLVDIWHNIGKVILSNLFWTVTFVPCLLVYLKIKENFSPLPLLLLGGSFLLSSPALAGIFVISRRIAAEKYEVETRDFFIGIKEHWGKSLIFSIVCVIILLATGLSLMFYGELTKVSFLSIIPWVISFWVLLFFLLAQIYIFPLMVSQKMGRIKILKTSLLLALNNIGFTFVILLFELAILFLCFITEIILLLVGVSMIALLQSNAFIEVAKRYTGEEIRKEVKREEGRPRDLGDIFRDFFFPGRYN